MADLDNLLGEGVTETFKFKQPLVKVKNRITIGTSLILLGGLIIGGTLIAVAVYGFSSVSFAFGLFSSFLVLFFGVVAPLMYLHQVLYESKLEKADELASENIHEDTRAMYEKMPYPPAWLFDSEEGCVSR